MTGPAPEALEALTAVELREAELLSWGAVGAQWTEDELLSVLSEHGEARTLLEGFLEAALIVRTPEGGYRSRCAETVRLLATLRQAFPGSRVSEGKPLVLDYRFLHRPRRRPARTTAPRTVLDALAGSTGRVGLTAARRLLPSAVSGFQQRSFEAVLTALNAAEPAGVMVTAGTGSGKTLAFYLPLLSWLAEQRAGRGPAGGALALGLYPRNELLKDQLRALLSYVKDLGDTGGVPALSVATWFGDTPISDSWARKTWTETPAGYVCPYLRCLDCDSDLLWLSRDLSAKPVRERLVCSARSCPAEIDGKVLRLTRDSARERPADIMLSTTESLNRQLSAPGNLVAFGINPATLTAVLLDEVHVYEGTTGAQNAILLRRLAHRLGRPPVWVGLSATLRGADEFFAKLVNLAPAAVTVVEPKPEELQETGAEYLLALRHDPHSRTGTLSASIQTCMALARSLDSPESDPFNPPPSSGNVFGSKLFAFTDKLDSTNRLYWDLLNAEGWREPARPLSRRPVTLAHLRGSAQHRLPTDRQEPAADRDPDGQWWWMADHLGHGVEADNALLVSRTSSQDRGVTVDAQVVVATATLEVGFDDERVGAVLQHKAPHDSAQFLQRKGRAGRNVKTRPWTVVVLGDWGRDRRTWEAYDALFDPELPPRSLPVDNLYVLRIQAVYALLDWLALELRYSRYSTWGDVAGPATALYPKSDHARENAHERQTALSVLLARLLRPGPERDRLRRHLQRALGLDDDAAASVLDTIFWEAPRPLLLTVVPTMRRRLATQWAAEEPLDDDSGVRTRTPLREFVPGNLFDDLLVPDVELQLPGRSGPGQVEHLPALRTLNEFCPGNVTRHFGIRSDSRRHWLPLPTASGPDGILRVDIGTAYRGRLIDVLNIGGEYVSVHSPVAAILHPVVESVRDASAVRPDWEFHVTPLGSGIDARLGAGADNLLAGITAHLHVQGGGVRTMRFARSARGTVWDPSARPVRLQFGTGDEAWSPGAVGVEVHCDALDGIVRLPEEPSQPTAQERAERLRHRLEVEADLPEDMTVFERSSLVEIVLLAVVTARLEGDDLGTDPRPALHSAAATLRLMDDDPTVTSQHAPSHDDWAGRFDDARVLAAIRDAVVEVSAENRSPAWAAWWRRRYTLSVAQLCLAALASLSPGVDSDEINIDLAPDDDTRFHLSEPSPGGTGQIEAFYRTLSVNPDGFTRALEDALTPSAAESMDTELTALLRADDQAVRSALDDLRESWRQGHSAVGVALHRLEQVTRDRSLGLGGPARTALSTRLTGPGAHPGLLDEVASWLALREQAREASGIEVDARLLGGLLAHAERVDPVLHLRTPATPQLRAQAVSNVLWPWGRESLAAISHNPYAPPLATSLPTVRDHVQLGPPTLDVTTWDDDRRDAVHAALLDRREIVLRAATAERAVLRTAVLDLQTRPIEVGSILCHPVVVGVRSDGGAVGVRLHLREAP